MYASRSESIIVFTLLQRIDDPAQVPWQSKIGHVVGFTNSARQRANNPSAGSELLRVLTCGKSVQSAPQAVEPQHGLETSAETGFLAGCSVERAVVPVVPVLGRAILSD